MINTQPKTHQDLSINGFAKPFPVAETFYSIQGEGLFNGWPAFFIRMAGCNNRCYFCDTDYTSDVEERSAMGLVSAAKKTGTNLVVITGGEPFLYDISRLVTLLDDAMLSVQIETSGNLSIPHFPWDKAVINCSPKTKNLHPDILANAQNFRYTVQAGQHSITDGLPISSTQTEGKDTHICRPPDRIASVEVSPMDESDPETNKMNQAACVEIAKRYNYRLNLQQHKILGVR